MVGENIKKHSLLLNIKEIFIEFKKQYPIVKIGFSKFCKLRPKWAKTVNHSGMYSVCVCQYHQNVKLLVSIIPLKLYYREVFSKIVCSIDSRKCMFHLCFKCPGRKKLNDFLVECFSTNDIDLDDIFFSKAQVNHLRTAKENLLQNAVITLLDFAENYSFVAKDVV